VAAIRGRLELISHLIDEFGFSKTSGLSLSAVMGFVRPHLDAPDEKVRRAAVEVTVSCYSLKGERTLKFCSNLKPALLKLLEQRFAEVDHVKTGGKRIVAGGLPEVRGTKLRKSGQRHNSSSGSSRQSTSSSVGSRSKPLAPLEVSPGGRISGSSRAGSRGSNQSLSRQGQGSVIMEDEAAALHADLFSAQVAHDVIRSPVVNSSTVVSDTNVISPQPQYGMAIDPVGHSSLARHEDPNYIPSPTAPGSDPFSVDDEAFMDEIEDYAHGRD